MSSACLPPSSIQQTIVSSPLPLGHKAENFCILSNLRCHEFSSLLQISHKKKKTLLVLMVQCLLIPRSVVTGEALANRDVFASLIPVLLLPCHFSYTTNFVSMLNHNTIFLKTFQKAAKFNTCITNTHRTQMKYSIDDFDQVQPAETLTTTSRLLHPALLQGAINCRSNSISKMSKYE